MSPAAFPARDISTRILQLETDPALALIFPGQGSQKPGMGNEVRASSTVSAEVFAIADRVLGIPISELCANGPEDELTLTSNAQPAILATSIAILGAAIESEALPARPAYMAGHSLGEYSALVAAGALPLDDAIRMVRRRGELMQEAGATQGGTLAAIVGLEEQIVLEVCRESGAEVANYNAPTQTVVGGTNDAVERACALAKERGGRGLPVNVSGAFHTSLMAPAAEEFAAVIDDADVRDPAIPVIGNVTATHLPTAAEVRDDLRAQIRTPVRWYQSLDVLEALGVTRIIEIGPGRILTNQAKRSNPALEGISLDEAAALEVTRV
jgi:[acyl-carrier-protein] S-malonyltransferase